MVGCTVVIAWPAAVLRMSNKEFELVAEDNLLAKNGRFASKFRDESTFEPAKIMVLAGLKEDNPWEIERSPSHICLVRMGRVQVVMAKYISMKILI